MCTSFTYEDADKNWYLSRTMDFEAQLGGRPVVIPRHYHFDSTVTPDGFAGDYGFAGTGRDLGGYFVVDGVNEAGLGAATLYLEESHYSDESLAGDTNLASPEVVPYLLGHFATVAELKAAVATLNVVASPNPFMKIVVPLHWVVADKTGAMIVLEQTGKGLEYFDDPAGVMTNSPQFPWHLLNLNQYPHLQATIQPQSQFGDLAAKGFGAGTGAVGLPGDYTSPSRFVRMAYLRQNAEKISGEANVVNTLSHLSASVNIPKGEKLMANGGSDYTQYRGYMCLTSGHYYFQPYQDQTIYQIRLTQALLNDQVAHEYPVAQAQQIQVLN
ncbi:choloylglycine hydrolase family protein [Lacticaseibacillus sp. N501-2]|uniref:choloylglycine hydrolase family protein n=1 Tax=Lacticaseibacillus salsurae TaxID=3367729 RepID=UPI0038B3D607